MLTLLQFIYRLSFGLALAMAVTNPRQVTSGYYRNHLYVLLGMNVLAALVAWQHGDATLTPVWPPVGAALLSYVGSVVWLYEQPRSGILMLVAVAALSLSGAWMATPLPDSAGTLARALAWLNPPTGGLLLGSVTAAMLLGHWYLNAPGMKLEPLYRLIYLGLAAVALRAIVVGLGLGAHVDATGPLETTTWLLLALRWLAGVAGVVLLLVMAALTLIVPNTQSATGILYVAVLAVFLGELTSQLLSAGTLFPL